LKRLTLSLKTKMTFGVCLIVAGLTAALAFISLSYFHQQLRENVAAQQFVLISSIAGNIDDNLAAAQEELLKIAKIAPPGILQDPERAQAFLEAEAEHKSTFDNSLIVFSRRGDLVAESPFVPGRRGRNFAFRDFIKETLTSGRPVVSAPFLSTYQHRHPVVALTAPLLDPAGRVAGVLVGGLDLTRRNFLGKMAHTRIGRNGYLYLFDTSRTVIMHPDESRIMARDIPPGANRGLDRAVAGFEGTLETVNSSGRPMLTSFRRLKSTNWILAVNFPQAEAYADLEKARRYQIVAMLAAIALCVAVIWFYMEHITAPLQRLAGHARSLSGKRGSQRLFASEAASDIAVLAAAFNSMLVELDQEREAVRESEQRLRQIAEHCEEVLFIVSSDLSRMIYINPAYQKLWQLSCQSVYERPGSFLDLVHGEDRDRVVAALKDLAGGRFFNETFRIVRPDRTQRWVHARTYPVRGDDGAIYRHVGIVDDVTRRKLVEEQIRKMQLAVEQSPVSIVITDREGTIEYVNPKFTKLTGYSSAEAVGRNSRILKTGKTPIELYRQLWEQISSGGEWHGEILNKKKSGEFFWESVRISPIKTPDGEITHYLGVKEDITARKGMEQELRNARDAAEAADLLKSEFLANMSHEIRTPMNGVIGMTDLLKDTDLTREQSEYVQALSSSAGAMLGVINDILDFSSMEARKLELEKISFGLRASLETRLSPLRRRAGEKGLQLAMRISPAVPDALIGDRGRLMQALGNLVSNAIKFSESGEVALCITVVSLGPTKVALRFCVADSGIGISAEQQRSVFEPFSQADASATRRYGGTGLGLTISARLVQMMGGCISVESEPGKGSCFSFELHLELQGGMPAGGADGGPEQPRGTGGGAPVPVAEAFEYQETLARMDGDWELFREVAGIFAADSRTMMAQIRGAICTGDAPGLNRAAHTLKGTLSNFGARVPFELALRLEQLGKNGGVDGAWECFDALETELERLREALETCAQGGSPDEDTDSRG
jgi:PAS domain S-box-containing protein